MLYILEQEAMDKVQKLGVPTCEVYDEATLEVQHHSTIGNTHQQLLFVPNSRPLALTLR
jgi:hypothetical protein